ncbi:hypothetical protein CMI47_21880 [Candidatus Pacearchaeota archaeon]|nr:hypothetical protein [Candidatus Pacearchaeota archaeon]|tara:strand:- start:65 stop:433 length:369 start_codon:yes stop_codon:yes gene_type:complete
MARKKKKLWSKQSTYTTVDGFEVKMDSTWEVAMALRLDELGIRWMRNDKMFLPYLSARGRKRKYIPDFYLPDYDLYVEVKGYFTDAARHKMKSVLEINDVRLIILESLAEIQDINNRPELLR